MEWDKQSQLASCLNNEMWKEAVEIMKNEPEWDPVSVNIFLSGMRVTSEFCSEVIDRLMALNPNDISYRNMIRLSAMKVHLDMLKEKDENEIA